MTPSTSPPAPLLYEFQVSYTNFSNDTDACAATSYMSAWSNNPLSNGGPTTYDTVYIDNLGTTYLNSGYYKMPDTFPAENWIQVGSEGIVINRGLCGGGL